MRDRVVELEAAAARALKAHQLVVERRTNQILGHLHFMGSEGLEATATAMRRGLAEIRESLSDYVIAVAAVEAEADGELEKTNPGWSPDRSR